MIPGKPFRGWRKGAIYPHHPPTSIRHLSGTRFGSVSIKTPFLTPAEMALAAQRLLALMKATYGLRDEEYLELRLKSLHEAKLRLTGKL